VCEYANCHTKQSCQSTNDSNLYWGSSWLESPPGRLSWGHSCFPSFLLSFLGLPFLPTHCRCIELLLDLKKPSDTQTHTRQDCSGLGIRTGNSRKRAAVDPHLRPSGHRDRFFSSFLASKFQGIMSTLTILFQMHYSLLSSHSAAHCLVPESAIK
jgi:hypothetical protein